LLSSQSAGVPLQVEPSHFSLTVHLSLSLHPAPGLALLTQPLFLSQLSTVHALPSSQLSCAPPLQDPLVHVSTLVHASPSEQPPDLGAVPHLPEEQTGSKHGPPPLQSDVDVQLPPQPLIGLLAHWPLDVSHESAVHASLSSQLLAAPDLQLPDEQLSPWVQASLSLQDWLSSSLVLHAPCAQAAFLQGPASGH